MDAIFRCFFSGCFQCLQHTFHGFWNGFLTGCNLCCCDLTVPDPARYFSTYKFRNHHFEHRPFTDPGQVLQEQLILNSPNSVGNDGEEREREESENENEHHEDEEDEEKKPEKTVKQKILYYVPVTLKWIFYNFLSWIGLLIGINMLIASIFGYIALQQHGYQYKETETINFKAKAYYIAPGNSTIISDVQVVFTNQFSENELYYCSNSASTHYELSSISNFGTSLDSLVASYPFLINWSSQYYLGYLGLLIVSSLLSVGIICFTCCTLRLKGQVKPSETVKESATNPTAIITLVTIASVQLLVGFIFCLSLDPFTAYSLSTDYSSYYQLVIPAPICHHLKYATALVATIDIVSICFGIGFAIGYSFISHHFAWFWSLLAAITMLIMLIIYAATNCRDIYYNYVAISFVIFGIYYIGGWIIVGVINFRQERQERVKKEADATEEHEETNGGEEGKKTMTDTGGEMEMTQAREGRVDTIILPPSVYGANDTDTGVKEHHLNINISRTPAESRESSPASSPRLTGRKAPNTTTLAAPLAITGRGPSPTNSPHQTPNVSRSPSPACDSSPAAQGLIQSPQPMRLMKVVVLTKEEAQAQAEAEREAEDSASCEEVSVQYDDDD